MGGKSHAPDPPDYSGLIAMNEKTALLANKLATDQFNWAKSVYNENKGLMKQTNTSFLKTMENARIASEEDRARYKSLYQPLESRMVADARTYDTQARRDKEVGAAQANVAQSFESARQSAQQQLESFGVNPSATRFAALDLGMRTQEAAQKAAAGTAAGNMVEDKARALMTNAVNIGRGYPAQYVASQQAGVGAGGAAQAGTQNAFAVGANAMGTGPQWLAGGNQAMQNWGNNLNQSYDQRLAQFNANQNQSSGWGSILGMLGGVGMKAFGFEEGGTIPPEVSPSQGAVPDDAAVPVTVGEFVIPKQAVEWYGQKHFHKLIEKAKEERQQAQAVPTGPIAMGA